MHWPCVDATMIQPVLTKGLKEGSWRIPCLSKVPGQCQLAELSYNPAVAIPRNSSHVHWEDAIIVTLIQNN